MSTKILMLNITKLQDVSHILMILCIICLKSFLIPSQMHVAYFCSLCESHFLKSNNLTCEINMLTCKELQSNQNYMYLKSPKYSGIFIQDNYVNMQVTNI